MIPPKRAKLSAGISFSQVDSSPLEVNQRALSSFEKLPRELAFDIFEYVPESVQNLRMASSTLRNQINAFALERSTVQLVDELRFETKNGKAHRVCVTLALAKERAFLFELRYQLRRGCIAKSRIKRNQKEQVTLYEIMIRKREYKLWECISAAIGMRIGRVSIISCFEKNVFDTVNTLLQELKFKTLVVDSISFCHICGRCPAVESDVATSLLEIIAAKDINHLQMSLLLSPRISFEKYLFNVSSLVRSLAFDPRYAMYGKEADIPRIVIGILSRKVDTLLIEDNFYRTVTNYFSQENFTNLAERIRQLDKKVWFQTSCHGRVAVSASFDNYQIEGNCGGPPPNIECKGKEYLSAFTLLLGYQASIQGAGASPEEITNHLKI